MEWAAGDALGILERAGREPLLSLRRLSLVPGQYPPECPYEAPAVRSVGAALNRSKQLQGYIEAHESRGRHDGISCFNQIFLVVASRLLEGLSSDYFSDPKFVADFTVRLSNGYFGALRSDRGNLDSTPACWGALLERRQDPQIPGIVFSVAGTNALLNYVVPSALFESLSRRRFERNAGGRRRDYNKVLQLFMDEAGELIEHFSTSLIRVVEPEAFDHVSRSLECWSIDRARAAGWRHAQLLGRLRDRPRDQLAYLAELDSLVSTANRLLLAASY